MEISRKQPKELELWMLCALKVAQLAFEESETLDEIPSQTIFQLFQPPTAPQQPHPTPILPQDQWATTMDEFSWHLRASIDGLQQSNEKSSGSGRS